MDEHKKVENFLFKSQPNLNNISIDFKQDLLQRNTTINRKRSLNSTNLVESREEQPHFILKNSRSNPSFSGGSQKIAKPFYFTFSDNNILIAVMDLLKHTINSIENISISKLFDQNNSKIRYQKFQKLEYMLKKNLKESKNKMINFVDSLLKYFLKPQQKKYPNSFLCGELILIYLFSSNELIKQKIKIHRPFLFGSVGFNTIFEIMETLDYRLHILKDMSQQKVYPPQALIKKQKPNKLFDNKNNKKNSNNNNNNNNKQSGHTFSFKDAMENFTNQTETDKEKVFSLLPFTSTIKWLKLLISSKMTKKEYENRLLTMFCGEIDAFKTLDQLLIKLCYTIFDLISDKHTNRLISLFLNYQNDQQFPDLDTYFQSARNILKNEALYKFHFSNKINPNRKGGRGLSSHIRVEVENGIEGQKMIGLDLKKVNNEKTTNKKLKKNYQIFNKISSSKNSLNSLDKKKKVEKRLWNYFENIASKNKIFLTRNKKNWMDLINKNTTFDSSKIFLPEELEYQLLDAASTNVLVRNDLEFKFNINSLQKHFINNTEDFFYRLKNRKHIKQKNNRKGLSTIINNLNENLLKK
ncbi:gata zinc finger domain-containing protein 10-related [Anaeramoeba flamelloides]|uniref:Gata zinc finger domain-containing protein 10-related n=1 Tax=Anaeramoeba flamelloides TaxID=1746091 RepID=A0AAV8A0Q0_9EUKA|nr:gata zinc finger domain-containing protein 10-related [Anaeramoeba flamelloides]